MINGIEAIGTIANVVSALFPVVIRLEKKLKPQIDKWLRLYKLGLTGKNREKLLHITVGAYMLLIWDQLGDDNNKGGWGKTLEHYSTSLYPEVYPDKKPIPKESLTHTRWALQGLLSVDPSFEYSPFAKLTNEYIKKLKDPKGSGAFGRFKYFSPGDSLARDFEANSRHTAGAMYALLMLNGNKPNKDIHDSVVYLLRNQNEWLSEGGHSHYNPAVADITASLVAARTTSLKESLGGDLTDAIDKSRGRLIKSLGTDNYWTEIGYPHAELQRTLWILRDCDFGECYPEEYWKLLDYLCGLFRDNLQIMPFAFSSEGISLGNAASLFLLLDDAIRNGYAEKRGKREWCLKLQKELVKFIVDYSDNLKAHEFDFTVTWSEILTMFSRCFQFPKSEAQEMQSIFGQKVLSARINEESRNSKELHKYIENVVIRIAKEKGLIPYRLSHNKH